VSEVLPFKGFAPLWVAQNAQSFFEVLELLIKEFLLKAQTSNRIKYSLPL
jgi:hypothetical protein